MNVQRAGEEEHLTYVLKDDGELLKRIAQQLDAKINAQAVAARKLDEPSLAIITALDMLHESALEKHRLADELESIQAQLDAPCLF